MSLDNAADVSEVFPPAFGDYLRELRGRPAAGHPHGYTRPELAAIACLSISYLTQLEHGERTAPTPATLIALARALRLSPDQARHLNNLARPRHSRPPSAATIGPDVRRAADALNPSLACYLDEQWNVLYANSAHDKRFPGLVADGNMLRWTILRPDARQVLAEWRAEAEFAVAAVRALMGQHPNPDRHRGLLAELSIDPGFRAIWRKGAVVFDRPQPYIRLRDLHTSQISVINTQIFTTRARRTVQIHIGTHHTNTL
ncbi:helix-turn-helix domain-containing protein [Aldersonia sp. NBC_00410]|uniref:helix-turn-helix domain-containing protein n=1 Tax=Aldersonia sp. NBC_00410 TaxID=2975954 RepID=UPI00224FFAB2|nr:helix-turn-helix domain-containing protein [Aldersonia sp. NBC_00410]MCX5046678.1 helix-turn-helix domain-containing protein [Aldersonia sp. NBC_00410]